MAKKNKKKMVKKMVRQLPLLIMMEKEETKVF